MITPLNGPTTKTPAHQAAYLQLREAVMFGDFVPGQAVTLQGLVDHLGAGMTPVREALRRLIAEGALIMHDNRRVSVPELARDSVQELEFMRLALEPELARRCANLITLEALEELNVIDARLNLAITRGDVAGYLRFNYAFHTAIYASANAPIMAVAADGLWLRFGPSMRIICGRFGTMNLPDKHAELLAALARRDADGVALAMSEDVRQGMKQIVEQAADLGQAI